MLAKATLTLPTAWNEKWQAGKEARKWWRLCVCVRERERKQTERWKERKWTPAGGVVEMIHIRSTFIDVQGMQGVLVRLPPSLPCTWMLGGVHVHGAERKIWICVQVRLNSADKMHWRAFCPPISSDSVSLAIRFRGENRSVNLHTGALLAC